MRRLILAALSNDFPQDRHDYEPHLSTTASNVEPHRVHCGLPIIYADAAAGHGSTVLDSIALAVYRSGLSAPTRPRERRRGTLRAGSH